MGPRTRRDQPCAQRRKSRDRRAGDGDSNFRKSADQAFERAIARLSDRNFANREQGRRGGQACAMGVVLELRGPRPMPNSQARKRQSRRSCPNGHRRSRRRSSQARTFAWLRQWMKTTSRRCCPISRNLKHFVWIMSEYLGRERGRGGWDDRRRQADERAGGLTRSARSGGGWKLPGTMCRPTPPNRRRRRRCARKPTGCVSRVFRSFEDTRKAIYAAGTGRRNLSDELCRVVQPVNRGN